jgi:hypothetical protein
VRRLSLGKAFVILLSCLFVLSSCSIFVRSGHSGGAGSGWISDSLVSNQPVNDSCVGPAIGADSLGNLYAAYISSYAGYSSLAASRSVDGGKTWNWTGSMGLGGNVLGPSMAVAVKGNNEAIIAFEVSGSGIGLEVTKSGGAMAWIAVSSPHVHQPQITVDNSVPIFAYLVYENDSTGIPGDSDIYFMRSTDYDHNWSTWEKPYALAGASDSYTYSNPTIAYGNLGNLYVAFERNNGSTNEIYVMQNTAYGVKGHWSAEPGTLISPPTMLNKYRPRVAASSTTPGTIIVAWEEAYSSTDYDIGYAYSTNTGNTWSSSLLYLARTYTDERNPSITVDDTGYFHVAYWSGEDGGTRTSYIYYREAIWTTPNAWTNAEQAMDDNGQAIEPYNMPAVTAQERGVGFYPVIAWTDSRGSLPKVYATTWGATCTIKSSPSSSGGFPTVQVDGVTYATPMFFNWPTGLNHTLGAQSPQTNGGVRYLFTGWSDSGSRIHQIVASTVDVNITASFVIQYGLTVSTDPTTLNPQPSISPAGPWYYMSTAVNITAQMVIGSYSLNHWTVDGVDFSPNQTISVTMNQPHSVIAKYGLDTTAPLISNLVQNPAGKQVPPNQSVGIQATVIDTETGVKNVTLQYRTSHDNSTWSSWMTNPMNKIATDTYSSTIAGSNAGTFVQYKIAALDNAGNSRTLPLTQYFAYSTIPELPSLLATTIFLFSVATLLFLSKRKHF